MVWLLSLGMIILRCTQDILCINSSFCLILNGTPLCKYHRMCLPFYLLMGIWVISGFWSFKIKLHLWLSQIKLFSPHARGWVWKVAMLPRNGFSLEPNSILFRLREIKIDFLFFFFFAYWMPDNGLKNHLSFIDTNTFLLQSGLLLNEFNTQNSCRYIRNTWWGNKMSEWTLVSIHQGSRKVKRQQGVGGPLRIQLSEAVGWTELPQFVVGAKWAQPRAQGNA